MRSRLAVAVLATAISAVGCGGGSDDDSAPAPRTAFLDALATVDAGEPVGAGIGWIDADAIREGAADPPETFSRMAPALGPGGGALFAALQPEMAKVGVDPYESGDAISIVASFTFGVRLDRVDPSGVKRIAAIDGKELKPETDGWTRYDLADRGVLPDSRLQKAADALSSHVGIGSGAVVLSRADQARHDLTLVEHPGDETASLQLAAECLGDVVAARVVPNNFTYISGVGPDLFVMGARAPEGDSPGQEVICGVDESADAVESYASALDEQLAPEAVDITTGKPIGEVYDSANIDTLGRNGVSAARAVVTLADGAEPGAVFRAFDTGALVTYFGLQGPGSKSVVPVE